MGCCWHPAQRMHAAFTIFVDSAYRCRRLINSRLHCKALNSSVVCIAKPRREPSSAITASAERRSQVELVEAGRAVGGKGWQNKGYIFPDGFRSRTVFRSSVDPEQVCVSLNLLHPQGRHDEGTEASKDSI